MKKLYHLLVFGMKARLSLAKIASLLALILMFWGHSVDGFGQELEKEVVSYESDGSFFVPAGVTEITVEAWGAGGGGGNRTSNGYAGGGGGGAYAMKVVSVSPEDAIPYTIGTRGTSGNNGGASAFGNSVVVAAGGKSGSNNNQNGAEGGSASQSIGDVRFSGGNGANGGDTGGWRPVDYSGPGGSAAGSTGNGNHASGEIGGAAKIEHGGAGANSVRDSRDGNNGSLYGGGGSGAIRNRRWDPSRIGGSGANGLIRISYVPGYRADVSEPVVGSNIWEIGEERSITVPIRNTGQATWTSPDVEIGVRWLDGSFQTIDPASLASGENRDYQIPVIAPMTQGAFTFDVEVNYPDGTQDTYSHTEVQNVVPSVDRYYSYKSGSWDEFSTWTHDPSGTTQVSNTLPTAYDEVFVLSGRHVSLFNDISDQNLRVSISDGGILDLSTYSFTEELLVLKGQGTLRLASASFPLAVENSFVLAGGGTTEYYNGSDFNFPSSQQTYNNLVFNASGVTATQKHNLILNGDLLVRAGTFQINDNSNVRFSLTINGSITINNGGGILVGTGNTTIGGSLTEGTTPFINYYTTNSHTVIVKGDFVNNGIARFTNQTTPDFNSFPNDGFATVFFQGPTDNMLYCNGQTDFYNVVLDKGLDQTYQLTLQSTAYSHFRLFGRNDLGGEVGGANPNLRKALWMRTGTLVLEGMTVIPALTEGVGTGDPNGDYYIPGNAALVLNGPEVIVLSTADDYREVNIAYGVSAADNNSLGLQSGGAQSFSIYGKLVINDGYMSTRESGGIITWDVASGQLEVNGGFLDAKQIRAAGGASGKFAYQQSGGTVALRGRFQRVPASYSVVSDLRATSESTISTTISTIGLSNDNATFNINSPANVFIMSGGKVQIHDVSGTSNRAIGIFAAANNINVTGGSFEIIPLTGNSIFNVNSTAPFGEFVVNRREGTAVVRMDGQPLVVKNNLNISSGTLNANNLDVSIGGNFSVDSEGTYNSGVNTTLFNGSSNQLFSVSGTLDNGSAGISLLSINKSAGSLKLAGDASTIAVQNDFELIKGVFDDGGKTLTVAGNVKNAGTHIGEGKVQLNGTNPQIISGGGVFQNLELNNNAAGAPVSLGDDLSIEGQLQFLLDRRFNIASYNLRMGAEASFAGVSGNRYVVTSGEAGAGGITKEYSSFSEFVFPLGVENYTPAALGFTSAPTSLGSITVVPVDFEHPVTSVKGSALSYFWRVKSEGFSGIDGKVNHSFVYNQQDVAGNEGSYVPAVYVYEQNDWSFGSNGDVDLAENLIGGWIGSNSLLDGDYTAGIVESFDKPLKFYSRNSGFWKDAVNWSTVGHDGSPAARIPAEGDLVIIENGHIIALDRLNMPKTSGAWNQRDNEPINQDVQNCAVLQIENGAVLDVTYNPGSNFGMVVNHPNGNGTIRVSTNYRSGSTFQFPKGDFSEFNANLGTTELYTSNPTAGTTYWLPNDIDNYGNLIITPLGGSNIIFGNTDVTIFGDLITRGQNSESWFCPTWEDDYPTAPSGIRAKTITIFGKMHLQGGALIFYGNENIAQDFVIHGDIEVDEGSGIMTQDVIRYDWLGNPNVISSSTNQSISLGGNLINNASFGPDPNGYAGVDFSDIPVIFFGENNASISNTSGTPSTTFGLVTVNKGNSQASKLTIDIGGTLTTPVDNWLTLENGTLEYKRTDPSTDFTITTGSSFTIPSTSGLLVDYTGDQNVLIANDNSDTNDMYLNGKLTVVNGTVYVGPKESPNNNNDIEYAGGGASSIDVRGGQLMVNGQIRRNPSTASGILKYTQSGGEVIINGRNANSTNAKLEVLNTGSVFNMSGGTLKLIQGGGGNAFGDLYLRPQSSSITGGDIIFENTGNVAQQYLLDATVPLNNLRIVGNTASSVNATAKLLISPLTLQGNLELVNGFSVFDANEEYNIALTLKGNLINNGSFEHREALTTFSGGAQSVEGSSLTGFYDLKINPVTSVTMTQDVLVDHNLELASGQLLLDETVMTVGGDLTNNATYRNAADQGGLVLAGSDTEHQISGAGTFGRLELSNPNGARLLNDITLQNDFILSAGVFSINQYLLTLEQNASILGSGFGAGKMIASDGVYSNLGIRKVFPVISSPQEFTFPMGFDKKYTPAVLTITKNDRVGSVRVNTINQKHPSAKPDFHVLNYYWEVESSAIDGFVGELNLFYHSDDVASDEDNYVAARLLTPTTAWNKAAAGADNVYEEENRIHFTYPGVATINGEYTAGLDEDIPDIVPAYESVRNGEWSDKTVWIPLGDAAECPDGGPNGAVVIINHEITASSDYCFAYKTTINGTLKILNSTYGHNLGAVNGNGTLYLESALMPAARFDDFFSCDNNATLELGGNSDYYIVADLFSSLANLKLSGTGSRYLPNKTLTVCNSLVVDGATLDNSVNNKGLILNGSFDLVNGGQFRAGTGSDAIVRFAGSAEQDLGGAGGSFVGSNAFNSLEVANASGLTLLSEVELTGSLVLTNGVIRTSSSELLKITNILRNSVTPQGGHAGSFVDGPLSKRIVQGDSFTFPVGKEGLFSNGFTLSAAQSGTLDWIVEYSVPNENYMDYSTPLSYVNSKEYWWVTAPAGSAANVGIAWTSSSDVTPVITEGGLSDLRVSSFNVADGLWKEISSAATGSNYSGVVTTSNRVSFNGTEAVKFTSATVNTVKPKAKLTPSADMCGIEQGIPVTFTSSGPISLPYILRFSIDGIEQSPVTVAALPFVLPTPTTGAYQLLGFAYNNGVNEGVVDLDVIAVYAIPTTASAGADISECGATSALLDANEPIVGAGLWSIVSGAGGTVVNPTQANSVFEGTNGSAYTLKWTISNGTCESFDEVVVVFPLLAEQPDDFNNYKTTVCQGASDVVYSVPLDATVNYSWEYSGSNVVIDGEGHEVRLQFGANATAGTLSVVASNDCNVSDARTIDVTVNEVVPTSLSSSAEGETLCVYNTVLFTVTPSSAVEGLVYSFFVNDVQQQSGNSNEYLATDLLDGAKVYVEASTSEGCKTMSNVLTMSVINTVGMWTGLEDSEWNNPMNWCDGQVPVINSDLVISSKMVHQPIVKDDITFTNLTIEEDASLMLDGGSRVDLAGTFLNDGELVLNNSYHQDGLVSLKQEGSILGSGLTRVKLTLPVDKWYYVSHPIKEAKTGIYDVFMPDEDLVNNNFRDFSHVAFHRNNKWYRVTGANIALWNLEGMSVKYTPSLGDEHTLNYTGVLNDAPISRAYDAAGFYLFGNPYPSYINWQLLDGWERPGISGTIWYRTRVNEEMGFVTYNREAPVSEARVAVYPDGVVEGNEDEIALIPPYQSAWVRAMMPTTLSITPAARSHGLAGSFLKSASSEEEPDVDVVRIVAENAGSYDGAVLYFYENSTTDVDAGDSEKRFNESDRIPEVYTKVGNTAMAINGMPLLTESVYSMALGVKNQIPGEVTLRIDMKNFSSPYSVYLEDLHTGAFTQVSEGGTYDYSVVTTGVSEDRFVLHFYKVSTDLDDTVWNSENVDGISIKGISGKALVSFSETLLAERNAKVEVFTVIGSKVSETTVLNSRTLIVLPNVGGAFLIRASAGNVVKTERVLGSNK